MANPVVIIGAGPAGLTAAYELGKRGIRATVLEADGQVGGISRTVVHGEYRFDIGGHRFFSKSDEIEALWTEIAGDEMLSCPRLTRIHYRERFFHYPLRPLECLVRLGPLEAAACVASFLRQRLRPAGPDRTLEEWVVRRFGRRLYEAFFRTYTEKVWGMRCSEIGADWAAQRIQDFDLGKAIRTALLGRSGAVVKTLIDRFRYPRLGPGQMWELCARKVEALGGEVLLRRRVTGLRLERGRVRAVLAAGPDGASEEIACDHCITSMPLRELVPALGPAVPGAVREAAAALRYRDFLTVGLIVDRADVFPDNWIYIHTPGVRVGRIQNFKRWSADMVPDPRRTSLGLEYFVWEGDDLWSSPDERLVAHAAGELGRLGFADAREVVDGCVIRQPKAYPIYDEGYRDRVGLLREWLEGVPNLHCVGRNGQHRYNNQDHSMATALIAARSIATGARGDAWSVNVDGEYHEVAAGERAVPQAYRAPLGEGAPAAGAPT